MIDDTRRLLYWLCGTDGEYDIGTCFGGENFGLTRKDIGGKWDDISKELVYKMVEDGLLRHNPFNDKFAIPETFYLTDKAHFTYWDERTKNAEWRNEIQVSP